MLLDVQVKRVSFVASSVVFFRRELSANGGCIYAQKCGCMMCSYCYHHSVKLKKCQLCGTTCTPSDCTRLWGTTYQPPEAFHGFVAKRSLLDLPFEVVAYIVSLSEEVLTTQRRREMASVCRSFAALVNIIPLPTPSAKDAAIGLLVACREGLLAVVQRLVEAGMNTSECAIEIAALYGHLDVVRYLLESGMMPSWKLFANAAFSGSLTIVQFLGNHTSILHTAEYEQLLCLACPAALLHDECYAQALESHDEDIVGYLALQLRTLFRVKEPLVHIASRLGNVHALAGVLKHDPASLSARCAKGNTPLHSASCQGKTSSVRILLDKGANCEMTNQYGRTPLVAVAWKVYLYESKRGTQRQGVPTVLLTRIMQLLLNSGANAAAVDDNDWGLVDLLEDLEDMDVSTALLREAIVNQNPVNLQVLERA